MSKLRRFSSEQKAIIVRRHLSGQEPVSDNTSTKRQRVDPYDDPNRVIDPLANAASLEFLTSLCDSHKVA